jgi:hypothetical protein
MARKERPQPSRRPDQPKAAVERAGNVMSNFGLQKILRNLSLKCLRRQQDIYNSLVRRLRSRFTTRSSVSGGSHEAERSPSDGVDATRSNSDRVVVPNPASRRRQRPIRPQSFPGCLAAPGLRRLHSRGASRPSGPGAPHELQDRRRRQTSWDSR